MDRKHATARPARSDRRAQPRTATDGLVDPVYSILRLIARHVRGFWTAIVAALTLGLTLGVAASIGFVALAGFVAGGTTRRIDESVIRWFDGLRSPLLNEIMLEVTTLGNALVLVVVVGVASIFLWLTHHRWSVYVLLAGVLGGQIVNNILKAIFARDRPDIIEWVDSVSSPSFPSGHAMSAFIAYGSVAYIVGRLEPTLRMRVSTWAIAALLIVAIGVSRIYLGVHYPSDVIAGFLAGLAWIGFVAASIRAVHFFAPRRPRTAQEESAVTAAHVDDA
jgi:undecaprenyl-diphosphatase